MGGICIGPSYKNFNLRPLLLAIVGLLIGSYRRKRISNYSCQLRPPNVMYLASNPILFKWTLTHPGINDQCILIWTHDFLRVGIGHVFSDESGVDQFSEPCINNFFSLSKRVLLASDIARPRLKNSPS